MSELKTHSNGKARSWSTFLAVYGAALLVTMGLCVLYRHRIAEQANPSTIHSVLRILLVVTGVGTAWAVLTVKHRMLRMYLPVAFMSIFLTTAAFVCLEGTPYNFGGLDADQTLRAASVTKFAHSSGFIDFAYKDLPAFYPPLYFYALGRASTLLNIKPYMMLKHGLLCTLFLLPPVCYVLWRLVLGSAMAVLCAFLCMVSYSLFKPDEWTSLFVFLPWWLYHVEGLRSDSSTSPGVWRLIWGAVLGALIIQTHYYWFFPAGVSLALGLAWRTRPDENSDSVAGGRFPHRFVVLSGAAILSAPYWLPLVLSMYRSQAWTVLQARFVPDTETLIWFPFLDLSVQGFFSLTGVVYLLFTARNDRCSRLFLRLVAACYVWFGIGFVAKVIHYPVLAEKAAWLLTYILCISAVLAIGRLWVRTNGDASRRDAVAPIILTGACVLFLLAGESILMDCERQRVQSGREAFPEQIVTAYTEMAGDGFAGAVVLTDFHHLPTYLPVYTFLPWNGYYSHPAAQFHDRLEFLGKLSSCRNPQLFAAAFMNNRWSRIDHVFLRSAYESYPISVTDAGRGNDYRKSEVVVKIPKQLFGPAFFNRTFSRSCVLFTPKYEKNPILPSELTVNRLPELDEDTLKLIRTLCTEFGDHLALDGADEMIREIDMLLKEKRIDAPKNLASNRWNGK